MGKIAVDVVVLPDEAMTEAAIEANGEIVAKYGGGIVLNKVDCLPHISLAMGCLEEGEIAEIERILEAMARQWGGEKLRAIGVKTTVNSRGEEVSAFEVERTEELQQLHEQVMGKLEAYLSKDVTEEMIHGGRAEKSTLAWIEGYRENSSFERFFPHITIGYGKVEGGPFPIEFRASKLALCHLGNHCTCRKILAAVDLR